MRTRLRLKLNAKRGATEAEHNKIDPAAKKQFQGFQAAVEETERRTVRSWRVRRGQHHGDSDEDEYTGGSEDNDYDAGEFGSDNQEASNLATTSSGQ